MTTKNGKREQTLVLTAQQLALLVVAERDLLTAKARWEQVLQGIFAAANVPKATILRMQEREGAAELIYTGG